MFQSVGGGRKAWKSYFGHEACKNAANRCCYKVAVVLICQIGVYAIIGALWIESQVKPIKSGFKSKYFRFQLPRLLKKTLTAELMSLNRCKLPITCTTFIPTISERFFLQTSRPQKALLSDCFSIVFSFVWVWCFHQTKKKHEKNENSIFIRNILCMQTFHIRLCHNRQKISLRKHEFNSFFIPSHYIIWYEFEM